MANINEKYPEKIKTLAEVQRDYILRAVKAFNGRKAAAAVALGISLKTLYNKLNSYRGEQS